MMRKLELFRERRRTNPYRSYEEILVKAAAPTVPRLLADQLAEGATASDARSRCGATGVHSHRETRRSHA